MLDKLYSGLEVPKLGDEDIGRACEIVGLLERNFEEGAYVKLSNGLVVKFDYDDVAAEYEDEPEDDGSLESYLLKFRPEKIPPERRGYYVAIEGFDRGEVDEVVEEFGGRLGKVKPYQIASTMPDDKAVLEWARAHVDPLMIRLPGNREAKERIQVKYLMSQMFEDLAERMSPDADIDRVVLEYLKAQDSRYADFSDEKKRIPRQEANEIAEIMQIDDDDDVPDDSFRVDFDNLSFEWIAILLKELESLDSSVSIETLEGVLRKYWTGEGMGDILKYTAESERIWDAAEESFLDDVPSYHLPNLDRCVDFKYKYCSGGRGGDGFHYLNTPNRHADGGELSINRDALPFFIECLDVADRLVHADEGGASLDQIQKNVHDWFMYYCLLEGHQYTVDADECEEDRV